MARSPVRLGLSLDLQEASKLLRFMGNQEILRFNMKQFAVTYKKYQA